MIKHDAPIADAAFTLKNPSLLSEHILFFLYLDLKTKKEHTIIAMRTSLSVIVFIGVVVGSVILAVILWGYFTQWKFVPSDTGTSTGTATETETGTGSGPDQLMYVTLNKEIWRFGKDQSPEKIKYSPVLNNITAGAMSENGQHIIYGSRGQTSVSSDGGKTFSKLSFGSGSTWTPLSFSMTTNGQHVICAFLTSSGGNALWYSTDYGQTFTPEPVTPLSGCNQGQCSTGMSDDGSVQCLILSGGIHLTRRSPALWEYAAMPDNLGGVMRAATKDAKLWFVVMNATGIFVDEFDNFRNQNPKLAMPFVPGGKIINARVSCSADVNHICAAVLTTKSAVLYISGDRGKSWNTVPMSRFVASVSQVFDAVVSRSGAAMAVSVKIEDTTARLLLSDDYGKSWSTLDLKSTTSVVSSTLLLSN